MIEIRKFEIDSHNFSEEIISSCKRADIEIYGVNTFRPSYNAYVFFNIEENFDIEKEFQVNLNSLEKSENFAGQFSMFGHAKCTGDKGHCDIPKKIRRFDDRPSHPLTPAFKRITVTDTFKKVIKEKKSLSITFLTHADIEEDSLNNKALLCFEGLQIVTFE